MWTIGSSSEVEKCVFHKTSKCRNNFKGNLYWKKGTKYIQESHKKWLICNSNGTKWSTIQGVIERVISKSDQREARGRFEIASTITPWIVRHEVQLLINRIYNKFREKNDFWELLSENVCSAFPKFWKLYKTLLRKPLKRAWLAWKSRGYPITVSDYKKVQIGQL